VDEATGTSEHVLFGGLPPTPPHKGAFNINNPFCLSKTFGAFAPLILKDCAAGSGMTPTISARGRREVVRIQLFL
jgi:hypothetical protein